jgi:hypothetical protein
VTEQVPAHWVRVQTLVDGSGLPAVLAMAGRPALPAELAEDEAAALKLAGARVLRDLTGRPCIREDDPAVITWRAALDERVTALSAGIEQAVEASRGG